MCLLACPSVSVDAGLGSRTASRMHSSAGLEEWRRHGFGMGPGLKQQVDIRDRGSIASDEKEIEREMEMEMERVQRGESMAAGTCD